MNIDSMPPSVRARLVREIQAYEDALRDPDLSQVERRELNRKIRLTRQALN